MRLKIGIVDYGLGNHSSVHNAFKRLGHRCFISCCQKELEGADGLVLPGVGAFPAAMKAIRVSGLDNILRKLTQEKRMPLLGICLGMQILADFGEEHGGCEGLSLIPGRVRRLEPSPDRKIPHVGWSGVEVHQSGEILFSRQQEGDAFYFDHSYFFDAPTEFRAATVTWDGEIVAAVARGHIVGVQFHPEKSQNAGLRLLKAFALIVDARKRLTTDVTDLHG